MQTVHAVLGTHIPQVICPRPRSTLPSLPLLARLLAPSPPRPPPSSALSLLSICTVGPARSSGLRTPDERCVFAQAPGAGYAYRIEGLDRVAVAYFGEGAASVRTKTHTLAPPRSRFRFHSFVVATIRCSTSVACLCRLLLPLLLPLLPG